MKIVIFAHSLASDWNHGNAHFLRGLMRALAKRGHDVVACERWRNWSTDNLLADHGYAPLMEYARAFPDLQSRFYGRESSLDDEVDELTRGAALVLVHEFNDPELVRAVGDLRARRGDFALLFHDTHHRAASAPEQIAQFELTHYDGVLAYGRSLETVYRARFGWENVWTFHEAADVTVFHPREAEKEDDVVWIGNWGDEERTREIREYLVDSARLLPELSFAVHGVRYPESGLREIREAGIDFRGWIANHRVPEAFARARMTVHIPRGPYLALLPGIPTIRPFEAMACGIPLLSTAWNDVEGLFREGRDYLQIHSPTEMREQMLRLSRDEEARARLAESGRETILARHTCDHRAEQLESIFAEVTASGRGPSTGPATASSAGI
ncbi:MAG TPA: glycosyltransferase [Longimicrobiaceae bacterium]|nr:glycosyltransferase [Longimicrobiaceae bacterium]